jgi:hypothetical protein
MFMLSTARPIAPKNKHHSTQGAGLIHPALCYWVHDAYRAQMPFEKGLKLIARNEKVPQVSWSKWRLIRP